MTRRSATLAAAALALALGAGKARAQTDVATTEKKDVTITATLPAPRGEIYGFAMLDMGYDFKQVNPDWFDVLRTTKLPSFPDEFGHDGHWYSSVRQSRSDEAILFDVRSHLF